MRKDTDKQINLTFNEEDYKELKDFCARKKVPVTTFLKEAAKMATLQDYKNAIPEQQDHIESFKLYMDKIYEAYTTALDMSQCAYEVAARDVKKQLDGLQELVQKTNEQDNLIKQLTAELTDKTTQISTLTEKLKEASSYAEDTDALKVQITTLTQQIADIQKEHNEEIKQLQNENFQKILSLFSSKTSE